MVHGELPSFVAEDSKSAAASSRRRSSSDPAITAAFFAFHRDAGLIAGSRRAGASGLRAFLSGGGWAFLGLAVVGFAGGLLLAVFPFNTPEHPITVAAHASEMLYAKPATSDLDVATAALASTVAADEKSIAAKGSQLSGDEQAKAANRRFTADGANPEQELLATAANADAPLPDATANLAAAMRLGAAGIGEVSGRGGDGVTVGYDAVELPSVPEPGTGPMVAFCLAALISFSRAGKNRRHRITNLR